MIHFIHKKQLLLVLSFCLLAFAGCKKYPNPPSFNEELDNTVIPSRKVLVISIDGLTGTELQTIAPPAITALQKNSKYSYTPLKEPVTNDVTSWVSMLTGVSYEKHLVSTDDFQPTTDPNAGEHDAVPIRRNVLDYIMSATGSKTAFISPWSNLRNYIKVADYRPLVATDEAAKDSTISLLNKYVGINAAVVNFREVAAAGANGGYLAANAGYKNAVLKADNYVDEIIKSIKARKTYNQEEWLIIITTNHGGADNDAKPGFIMLSNPSLKEETLVKRAYTGFNLKTLNALASAPNTNSLYDPGSNKSFTVQMDVKFNDVGGYWPGFLSKGTPFASEKITGWMWEQAGGSWSINYGQTSRVQLSVGAAFGDLNWHTLTMTVKYISPTSRIMTAYVDGVYKSEKDLTNLNLTNTEMLSVGNRQTVNTNFVAANLQYFNVALDREVVAANYKIQDITKHPNYGNLTGFWPMNENAGRTLINYAPNGYNMAVTGAYAWVSLDKNAPPSYPAIGTGPSSVTTPNAIGAIMMYWTRTKIDPVFDIDGDPILSKFEADFLK
ncbi:hypothetical protein OC25_07655 [Pedobacter kyungheensis]|uniref:Uncharacterized protein n=1 Tax=Pedobacter kyungheensis TaxID=1069985 RepID=A0A0C1DME2_9SPHI|nr:alkaline phosphatase family protein [Pedobacter kyungheensis]KIA95185.1 hypothetical protein OC25_07655 [Pedobacter kyungheensis]